MRNRLRKKIDSSIKPDEVRTVGDFMVYLEKKCNKAVADNDG